MSSVSSFVCKLFFVFFPMAVCAVAVRNCLECQQVCRVRSGADCTKTQKAMHSLLGTGKLTAKASVWFTCRMETQRNGSLLMYKTIVIIWNLIYEGNLHLQAQWNCSIFDMTNGKFKR